MERLTQENLESRKGPLPLYVLQVKIHHLTHRKNRTLLQPTNPGRSDPHLLVLMPLWNPPFRVAEPHDSPQTRTGRRMMDFASEARLQKDCGFHLGKSRFLLPGNLAAMLQTSPWRNPRDKKLMSLINTQQGLERPARGHGSEPGKAFSPSRALK